ncbi:hypothetical protein SODG_005289 [Sodalis praecaptivus]|nr:hypothetical protein NVIRENTERO_00100 [Sodalis praecaptivus]
MSNRWLSKGEALAVAAAMWMEWLCAPAPVKVTFVQEWPVADGFWIPWTLGIGKGFYRDEGIDLNVVAPPTVADTMKFLGTGRADVAFTTVMDIIFAKEQGRRSFPSVATAPAITGAFLRPRDNRSRLHS